MGLDMNIYRCRRPVVDDTRIYDREELNGIILNEEDIKEEMYAQLIPYCVKVRILNSYYDMEKIRKDYGLSDQAHICMLSYEGIGISNHPNKSKDIKISREEINEKYTLNKIEMCYFTETEEVAYWRKNYDIQGWFHDNISSNVENTGYYLLDEELLEDFNAAYPDDAVQVEAPDETSALFYWEWY